MTTIAFKHHAFTAAPVTTPVEMQLVRAFLAAVNNRVPSLDDMLELSQHSPQWIQTVRREGTQDYVGAFSVLPLNRGAKTLIATNLMSGAELRLDQLAPADQTPAGLYMGEVIALPDRFARAATVKAFSQKMEEVSNGYEIPVYTRPRTEEGLRLAESLHFKPVNRMGFQLGSMNFARKLAHTL